MIRPSDEEMLQPVPDSSDVCEAHDKPFDRWVCMAEAAASIDPALYHEYEVKRGLRDVTGKGVLAGLTQVGDVVGSVPEADALVPAPGSSRTAASDIVELVDGLLGSRALRLRGDRLPAAHGPASEC